MIYLDTLPVADSVRYEDLWIINWEMTGVINEEMMGCEDDKERNVRAVGMVVKIRNFLLPSTRRELCRIS